MKTKLILITALTLGFCLSARAATNTPTILDDHQLATVKGGFCPFEICEDAPGTGICETIPLDSLCALTKCYYSTGWMGSVMTYGCTYVGEYTCSSTATYRQCILHFSLSFCSYGNDLQCGFIVQPDCTPNPSTRTCVCSEETTKDPCDWTDCVQTF
jgi:hypothetical protein